MRLNKQQLDALTNKIYSEISEPIIKYNKELFSYENIYKTAKQELFQYKSLFKFIENKSINAFTVTLGGINCNFSSKTIEEEAEKIADPKTSHFLKELFMNRHFNKKTIPVTRNQIADEILLATIESENLEQIINTIKEKYQS